LAVGPVLIYFRHYYNPNVDPVLNKWQDGICALTKEQNSAMANGQLVTMVVELNFLNPM
jgi:hypothetical protein